MTSVHNNQGGREWILDAYRALEPQNYLGEFTSNNVRPDGRPFHSSRPVTVLTSFLQRNAYGSAMVTFGNDGNATDSNNNNTGSSTRVMAACTLLVGHPGPSTPTHGDIDVLVTASPLSGPRFDIGGRESVDTSSPFYNYQSGKDSSSNANGGGVNDNVPLTDVPTSGSDTQLQPTDTKEIESWIRRTLRSSRSIDPTELGIEPGKSAWRVRISIHIINHDGNLWDASLLCACAALGDLRLPVVEVDRRSGGVRIVSNDDIDNHDSDVNGKRNTTKFERRKGQSLTLGPLPVPLTVAILPSLHNNNSQNLLLVDPTHLEEDVSSGNFVTIVCNTNEEIVEFHKKGSSSRLSVDQIKAIASTGFGRAKELETLVKG